ncbi:unnamed protein product, partial [Brenthis ino]
MNSVKNKHIGNGSRLFEYQTPVCPLFEMRSTIQQRSTTIVALCAVVALVSAQVTFSRDWSGGKRTPPAVFDCSQFARLCRHFVHEMKEGMAEDKLNRHRRVELEDIPVTYEDEK